MAYQQSLHNQYHRADEIHAHRARRSYVPIAVVALVALAFAIWALARSRSIQSEDTSREAPAFLRD